MVALLEHQEYDLYRHSTKGDQMVSTASLGTVGVFISNGPIGFHVDHRPMFLKAGGDTGFACVLEESRHPYGNTESEIRAVEDTLGFPLSQADRVVIYVEHGTYTAIENLVKAGIAGERITFVTCRCYADEVRNMLCAVGVGRTELIVDFANCGGASILGTLLEHFRFDLHLHD